MSTSNKGSEYLKLRPSTIGPSKLVNDRGDFVKHYGSQHYNVNGSHYYTAQSAANAINKLGGKKY